MANGDNIILALDLASTALNIATRISSLIQQAQAQGLQDIPDSAIQELKVHTEELRQKWNNLAP